MLKHGEVKTKMSFNIISLALVGLFIGSQITAQENMRQIPTGSYKPFIKGASSEVTVDVFLLDEYAVTNADFLKFVEAKPVWAPDQVKALFADEDYLSYWPENYWEDTNLKKNKKPVVNISWFAANAYCKWKEKRLPTLQEWEYAAMALPLGETDSATLIQINTNWYSRKTPQHSDVGSIYENQYGVWDMYGLIWEWVYDFNSVVSNDDSRNSENVSTGLFCGSASLNASDASDYVSFIRFAYRGSLKGKYTTRKMGFRCAKSVD